MATGFRDFGLLQTSGANTGTHVIPTPSSVSKGDLLIAPMCWRTANGMSTVPAGWQFVADDSNSNVRGTIFIKRADANEPSNYTFEHGNTGQMVGAIIALKDPGEYHKIAIAEDSNDSPICPTLTTSIASFILRCVFIQAHEDNLPVEDTGYPAGTTGIYYRKATGGGAGSGKTHGAAYEVQNSAGATGTAQFDLGTSRNWIAMTLAITKKSLLAASTITQIDLNTHRLTYPKK